MEQKKQKVRRQKRKVTNNATNEKGPTPRYKSPTAGSLDKKEL
jgi:hypothetical protein